MFVVTGGAGFVGSNIVEALETRGLGPVAIVDRFGDERWRNVAERRPHSVIDPRDTTGFLDSCPDDTAVIHMGARTSTMDDDVDALLATNARLTADLFEHCANRGWPFVYASSAAVYGAAGSGKDDDDPYAELKPLNPYAWSKLTGDRMVLQRARDRSPPLWAGLRLFNVYGPHEAHKGEMRSFPTKCFDAIRDKRPIVVFRGSDRFLRDWVWVGDVARLVCDLLTGPPPHTDPIRLGGIYNVGTGTPVSFVDVAKACIAASGTVTPLSTTAFPPELVRRYQHHTRADTARLKGVAPHFQFTALADGLSAYWRDHGSSP